MEGEVSTETAPASTSTETIETTGTETTETQTEGTGLEETTGETTESGETKAIDYEKIAKDNHAAYTKSQQELKKLQADLAARDAEKFANALNSPAITTFREKLTGLKAYAAEYGDNPVSETVSAMAEAFEALIGPMAEHHDAIIGARFAAEIGHDGVATLLSPEFKAWAEGSDRQAVALLYEQTVNNNPKAAKELISMYAVEHQKKVIADRKGEQDAAAKQKADATAAPGKSVAAPSSVPTFTQAQIAKMTPAEYAKNRTAILAAEKAGRITG